MSRMSSWLAAWPTSLFSRMERGVVGGDVSQWIVALSSWADCMTQRNINGTKKTTMKKTLLYIIHTKRLHCMWTMNNPYRLDIGNRYRTVNNQLFSGNTVCRVIAQRQKGEWNSVSKRERTSKWWTNKKETKVATSVFNVEGKWRMIDRSWLLIMVLTYRRDPWEKSCLKIKPGTCY